jgi:hypothetical protein
VKSWILGTTENTVRWYAFDPSKHPVTFELLLELDLARVPTFISKEAAKAAAMGLGLTTWRYVRL